MDLEVVPAIVQRPTAADINQAAHALPGLARIEGIEDRFSVLAPPAGELLSADGFYLVLAGEVSLRLAGEDVSRLRLNDFFFEEHLALDGINSRLEAVAEQGTKLLKLDKENWQKLPAEHKEILERSIFAGDLINVHMHDFQQPINCCNITAVAFALTALGYPTHVDDLFLDCKLPGAYVVNDGMTLGEVYDVACIYLHQRGLKDQVGVECYYFDEEIFSVQHLVDALLESEQEAGAKDVLVANFGVGIAHNIPNNNGGHFALIAKYNPGTGMVHMVDVHPKKYGKLWVTSVDRLYRAMAQRDSSSNRARGLLRFTARNAMASKLDSLKCNILQVDMTNYLPVRDDNVASVFRVAIANLNSIGVVALSLCLLGMENAGTDRIMQTLRIPYTEALSVIPTPEKLGEIMARYLKAVTPPSGVQCHTVRHSTDSPDGVSPFEFFKSAMSNVRLKSQSQMIINIDVNRLMGCQAVSLPDPKYSETAVLKQFWCVCIDYDASTDLVTLADYGVATSILWQAKVDRLFEALEEHLDPCLLLVGKGAL
jgi:hypothetical protein